MSDVMGYYYLHTNGDLIFKKFCPEPDSDFVRRVWPVISDERVVGAFYGMRCTRRLDHHGSHQYQPLIKEKYDDDQD